MSSRTSAALSTTKQQATGAGHIVVGGVHRVFSFGAVRNSDGLVSGEAQLFNRATGFLSHAELICLTVIGNHAWMGGIIKHSDVPECEGTNMFFHAQDNGEGPERRTDLVSLAGVCDVSGEAAVALVTTYCDSKGAIAPYDLPVVPIEDGNIQVHE